MTNTKFAKFLRIHIRTLTDWKREKFLMPYRTAVKLSKVVNLPFPQGTRSRNKLQDISLAARLGGLAIMKKYGTVGGDPEYRKTRWRVWWKKTGCFSSSLPVERKYIRIPRKTRYLAEFVGIMIGDGGITQRQVCITLNNRVDYEYSRFVRKLIKKLFGIYPSEYLKKKDNTISLVLSRTNLVDFCKVIGLKIGNKIRQGLDIPDWIKREKIFQKACLRGLFDTDGCLVIHRYWVNKKLYEYKKINFSSASPFLISSIYKILTGFGFRPRISHNGRNVWIDSQEQVWKYIVLIGTHNSKHTGRFSRRGG